MSFERTTKANDFDHEDQDDDKYHLAPKISNDENNQSLDDNFMNAD